MTDQARRPSMSRRDWLLLPGLALTTVLGILVFSEAVARHIFPPQREILASCFVFNDPVHGVHARPDCSFIENDSESGKTIYQFDDFGYRNSPGLLRDSVNSYRIVMIGSSIVMGDHVSYKAASAVLLPPMIAVKSERSISLYNEGLIFGYTRNTDLRFGDALRASPNMILWMLTSSDISNSKIVNPATTAVGWKRRSPWSKLVAAIHIYFGEESFGRAAYNFVDSTRTAFAFRYYAYRSPTLYLKSYLSQVDHELGFLKTAMSPEWEGDLRETETDIADVSHKAHAAHVPLVIVYVPNHAQAEMVAMGEWPSGYDPYALDERLREMAQADGDTYLDILPEYRNVPIAEIQRDYLPVDGHPNAGGHALIARLIAEQLTSGAVPELASRNSTKIP